MNNNKVMNRIGYIQQDMISKQYKQYAVKDKARKLYRYAIRYVSKAEETKEITTQIKSVYGICSSYYLNLMF